MKNLSGYNFSWHCYLLVCFCRSSRRVRRVMKVRRRRRKMKVMRMLQRLRERCQKTCTRNCRSFVLARLHADRQPSHDWLLRFFYFKPWLYANAEKSLLNFLVSFLLTFFGQLEEESYCTNQLNYYLFAICVNAGERAVGKVGALTCSAVDLRIFRWVARHLCSFCIAVCLGC